MGTIFLTQDTRCEQQRYSEAIFRIEQRTFARMLPQIWDCSGWNRRGKEADLQVLCNFSLLLRSNRCVIVSLRNDDEEAT